MNSAVFGFRTLTTMPCQKILRSGAAVGCRGVGVDAPHQRADAEHDQVRGAGVADDVERRLRRGQQRR